MKRPISPNTDLIRFAEKVLALLNQGSFTATYKYAVLLGLMDLCMEHVSKTGEPPQAVTTRQLAEKTIAMYWPHTAQYPVTDQVLLQNQGRGSSQAAIVSAIARFRQRTSFESLGRCRSKHKASFDKLVNTVEWKLIEMPLPRVQIVGERAIVSIDEIESLTGIDFLTAIAAQDAGREQAIEGFAAAGLWER